MVGLGFGGGRATGDVDRYAESLRCGGCRVWGGVKGP